MMQSLQGCMTPQSLSLFKRELEGLLQRDIGLTAEPARVMADEIVSLLSEQQNGAFDEIWKQLDHSGVRERWNRTFASRRSQTLADWMAPYIVGSTLDLLCGDGEVGRRLIERRLDIELVERTLMSDAEYRRDPMTVPLETLLATAVTKRVDTVILCTVLHHEQDPVAMLCLAESLSRRRIIVVENCIDGDYDADYQLLVDLFFNHGLNRTCLPSPGRHLTADGWIGHLREIGTITHSERCAYVPGIPMPHHLFVVDLPVGADDRHRALQALVC